MNILKEVELDINLSPKKSISSADDSWFDDQYQWLFLVFLLSSLVRFMDGRVKIFFDWFWPHGAQLGKCTALSLDLGVIWDTL